MMLRLFWVVSFGLGLAFAAPAAEFTCKDCHEDHFEAKVGHYPAQDGACDMCHTVNPQHFDEGDSQFVKTNTNPSETCYQCHDNVGAKTYVHGALHTGEDSCLTCHDPHGSDNAKILVQPAPALCLQCHDQVAMTGTSTHSALQNGKSCVTCHNPHSSDTPKYLQKPLEELCLSCHNKPITVKDRTIPSIQAKIEKSYRMKTGTECNKCHFPHVSPKFPRLLRNAFPAKNYTPYYPGDTLTPNTYASCFDCHDTAMMNRKMKGSETSFRHDVASGKNIIRVNLHWFHVTNEASSTGARFGRSCRMCHDTHGASQARVIKTDIAPGATPLTFSSLERGGQCSGACHNVKTYQRLD